MGTHKTGSWGTPRFFDYSSWLRRRGEWKKEGYIPGDFVQGLLDGLADSGWKIWWKACCNEAGVFEVNFVVRTPKTAPPTPNGTEVMEVFGSVCDHVKGEPVFVSGTPRWSYWVVGLTPQKSTVQALLLGPGAQCGCDPWLNARASREVYESLREWLKGLD